MSAEPITVRFLGGPRDGEQLALPEVPPGRAIEVAIPNELPCFYGPGEPPPAEVHFERFVYGLARKPGGEWVGTPKRRAGRLDLADELETAATRLLSDAHFLRGLR